MNKTKVISVRVNEFHLQKMDFLREHLRDVQRKMYHFEDEPMTDSEVMRMALGIAYDHIKESDRSDS